VPGRDAAAAVSLGIDLVLGSTPVLRGVDWTVAPGEHWVVLGPNGAGKTTLLQIAAGYAHPTRGVARVLGERLGRVDVRTLRTRIGFVSSAIDRRFHPGVTAADAVVTARHGAVLPARFFEITEGDTVRAARLLSLLGCSPWQSGPSRPCRSASASG
jgi:iron complex transport system ATP-binding protein